MVDLRLLAVVDPSTLHGRDPVTAAQGAEAGGATAIQLRLKHSSAAEMLGTAIRLRRALRVPLFVNDRADVAVSAGAAGVHLGQDDFSPGSIPRLRRPGFWVGISVGSPAEADVALAAPVDYWSIGPLYRTASKPDAGVPLGPAGFTALARLAPPGMPVIGIGGITADNGGNVIRAGAAGVAVIGGIFGAADIVRAARSIREAVDEAIKGVRAAG